MDRYSLEGDYDFNPGDLFEIKNQFWVMAGGFEKVLQIGEKILVLKELEQYNDNNSTKTFLVFSLNRGFTCVATLKIYYRSFFFEKILA